MRHMRVSHQVIFVADDRGAFRFRSAMDGHIFPDLIVIADAGVCGRGLIREVLRNVPDDSPHMDFIMTADLSPFREISGSMKGIVGAQLNAVFNHGMRADSISDAHLHILANNR
jgi:hypothetical protein